MEFYYVPLMQLVFIHFTVPFVSALLSVHLKKKKIVNSSKYNSLVAIAEDHYPGKQVTEVPMGIKKIHLFLVSEQQKQNLLENNPPTYLLTYLKNVKAHPF